MRIFSVIIISVLIPIISCRNFAQTQVKKNKISKIIYAGAVPLFDPFNNEQMPNELTINVYFIDSFIVAQLYTWHGNFEEEKTDNDADTVKMILTSEKYLSNFFMYKKESLYGFYMDSSCNAKQLLADSFLNKFYIQYRHPRTYRKDWQLITTLINNNQVHERYTSIIINPISLQKDSLLMSYDKSYKDIDFSISPYLDSVQNSKMYDFRFIVSSYYDSTLKTLIPRQEVYIKLEKQEVSPAETIFINKLVEKYKNSNTLNIKIR